MADGWLARSARRWPALLVCGGSFALVQFFVSQLSRSLAGGCGRRPGVDGVFGPVPARLAAARIWHFADETADRKRRRTATPAGQIVSAWMPWLLLTAFVFLWGLPPVKQALNLTTARPCGSGIAQAGTATASRSWRNRRRKRREYQVRCGCRATGTGIFVAAVVSACWLRVRPRRFVLSVGADVLPAALAAVHDRLHVGHRLSQRATAAWTRRSAWPSRTPAVLYPLFAALLGWLGVALTGSDTSSNALFGSLQTITARRSGGPGRAAADGTAGNVAAGGGQQHAAASWAR